VTSPRKQPGKPTCSPQAICFSGEVSNGQEFRHTISPELDFVLQPGWTIAIALKKPEGDCNEFASVVNAPYRAHRDLYIDTSYGWTAEQEVYASPRSFRFVMNCADYRTESSRLNIALWGDGVTGQKYDEALAKLGTSPLGTGRLWITASHISHSNDTSDNKSGSIQWMRFTVEIKLPSHNKATQANAYQPGNGSK
jgi:hypothetical protein